MHAICQLPSRTGRSGNIRRAAYDSGETLQALTRHGG